MKLQDQFPTVNPGLIFNTISGYMSSQILKSGLDFDVFTHIAEGKTSVADIAHATGTNPRAMRYLLDALTGLNFLSKPSPHTYSITPISKMYLVKHNPFHFGFINRTVEFSWKPWGQLSEVIKTGKPVETEEVPEDLFKELSAYFFSVNHPIAIALTDTLEVGKSWKGFHLLDIASGAAAWSIAFAQRDPRIRVTANDFPKVLEVTKQFTERFGVAHQYTYLEGSTHEVDFGSGLFDAAIIGNYCHIEGESYNRALFKKVSRALRNGGKILIADMIADEDRSTATYALNFAVGMLIKSEEGDAFTLSQFKTWLEESNFKDVELMEFPGPVSVIQAVKETP